jgi:hypothetical protein
MYRSLEPRRLIDTLQRLRNRIAERFPDASLVRVADDLLVVCRDAARRAASISRPFVPLRLGILLLLGGVGYGVYHAAGEAGLRMEVQEAGQAVQTLESFLAILVYAGAAVIYLFSLENRVKRRRALDAIHEIRALAHVVDMHQLTKDPESVVLPGQSTPSSPKRTLTPFQLSRYLDYCSEMLSLMGKVAALYVQDFKDPVALSAVDDVESLTTGLSRKIWQKITLIESERERGGAPVG